MLMPRNRSRPVAMRSSQIPALVLLASIMIPVSPVDLRGQLAAPADDSKSDGPIPASPPVRKIRIRQSPARPQLPDPPIWHDRASAGEGASSALDRAAARSMIRRVAVMRQSLPAALNTWRQPELCGLRNDHTRSDSASATAGSRPHNAPRHFRTQTAGSRRTTLEAIRHRLGSATPSRTGLSRSEPT
jgi:hypothetical protein